ncbi:MAG: TIGR02147 family protein [Chitinispirillaceae bacterium]|nr:TIGR02147 family protein [Chitinispirillaceae bacterium]
MQPIEFYTDYRTFLSDFYNQKKRSSRVFSYRSFCLKSGLKSPSVYREVVAGKRNLTAATIEAFSKGLGLPERDRRFFENLVLFNQAKSEEAKKRYLAVLRGLRYRKPQKQIPVQLYAYYDKWYNPVVRELAVAMKWNDDYALLAKAVNPPIKTSEARESVNLLLRLGFLRKRAGSGYVLTDPDVTTGNEVNSLAVRALNREYARLGLEAIDRFPPTERDISSVIMAVPRAKLAEFKREIVDFRKRIVTLANDEATTADSFYSLVVEFFPVGASIPKQGAGNEKVD